MKYRADTRKMENAVNDLKNVEILMTGYAQRLAAIKTQLGNQTELDGFPNLIENRIKTFNIFTFALKETGKCLSSIWLVYNNAEKRVKITTGILNWLKKIFDRGRNGGKKPGGGGSKPETEQAADLRMRNEALAKLAEYESKWRSARTEAEKRALLNSFLAEIQKILGTKAKSNINFTNMSANVYGSYNPNQGLITINLNVLNSPEGIRLLKTVIHEARHAYQYEAAFRGSHPSVSNETRQIWRNNYNNYKTVSNHGYDAYYNQPIERDAFWFSGGRNSK